MPPSQEEFQWTLTSTKVGLETEAVVSSTGESQLRVFYDVIVIGAEYAGLIVAPDISIEYGPKDLLIDVRDCIDGCTRIASVLGEKFEMGGTWIHW